MRHRPIAGAGSRATGSAALAGIATIVGRQLLELDEKQAAAAVAASRAGVVRSLTRGVAVDEEQGLADSSLIVFTFFGDVSPPEECPP